MAEKRPLKWQLRVLFRVIFGFGAGLFLTRGEGRLPPLLSDLLHAEFYRGKMPTGG